MDLLKRIIIIEKSIDLNDFELLGTNIWPLVRTELIKNSQNDNFGKSTSLNFKSLKFHFLDLLKSYRLFSMKGNLFLLYGQNLQSRYTYKGETYDIQFSPFKEKINPGSVNFIEFGKINSDTPKVNALNITLIFIIFKPFLNLYYLILLKTKLSSINSEISDFDIKSVGFKKVLIDFYSKKFFFERLLALTNFQNIFVKSFDNTNSFALVNAANQMGLKTIEYQHGQQGENSLRYSNWTKIPKDGFRMIPKYFWIWDKIFENKFRLWMKNQNYHKLFIGGNLWLDFMKTKSDFESLDLSTKHKHILLCLRHSELSSLMINCLRLSKNIVWHIRLHPSELHNIQKIKNQLLDNHISKSSYNLNLANKCSINQLLANINIVISTDSTVLYEASYFNKLAITTSKKGKEAYKEFIKKGLIYFADSPNDIINLVNNYKSTKFSPIRSNSFDIRSFLNNQ